MNYKEESYLMHYGVPGMKWGQRRKVYSAAIKKATKDKVDKSTAFHEETKKRMANTPRGKDRIAVRNAREFEYRSTIVKKYDSDVAKARSNMYESKLAYKKQKYDAKMAKKAERKAKWLLAEQQAEKASNLRKKYAAEYLKGQTTASKIIDYITYGSPDKAAMTYGELRAATEIGNPGED